MTLITIITQSFYSMKNITIKSLREKQKDFSATAETFFQRPKKIVDEFRENPKQASRMRKCANFVLFFIFVLAVGGIGGIIIDRLAIPQLLVKYPQLNKYEFFKNVSERTTIVEVTKEIKISEDRAVTEAIKKVYPSIVRIVEPFEEGGLAEKGSGLILTSDGYIITSIKNITPAETAEEKAKERKSAEPKIFKAKTVEGVFYDIDLVNKDLSSGLAIVKMEEKDLPVTAFADSSLLELGENLIVINDYISTGIVSKFINGYISNEEKQRSEETKTPPIAQKRIIASSNFGGTLLGAIVFNVKGEVVGIGSDENSVVLINEIKEFIEKSANR